MGNTYKSSASRLALATCASAIGLLCCPAAAQAQNVCIPILGGQDCQIDTSTADSPIPTVSGTLDATVGVAGDLLGTVGLAADGTISLVAESDILSNLNNVPVLSLVSNDAIDATVQSLTATGANSVGALLNAGSDATLLVNGLVSTAGDAADGINIVGDAVNVVSGAITTTGEDSDGVELVSLDGPITLDVDGIDTLGDFSDGALLTAAGDIDLDIGVLRTQGGQALGLNLSTDPTACVGVLTGTCSITGTVGSLTTGGDGSIGALIDAAAPVRLDISALETRGNDAAGISLVADPAACAVLGAGACGSDFTIGNLLTLGDNSPGVLAAIAAPFTLDVDALETNGAGSPGIAVTGDPGACVLLGSGACDTNLTVGNLLTTGDNSGGLAVDVPALVTLDLGTIATQGDNAPAIILTADPQACATLGVGACGIDLNATQITTAGDGSPGIGIAAVGPVSLDLGSVGTQGIDSPAVLVTADPAVCAILGSAECTTDINAGSITTGGDGSTALGVLAGGPVNVTTGPISTLGTQADGVAIAVDPTACVLVGAASCATNLVTGPVSTGGDGSSGVLVSAAGPLSVNTGNISTLGLDAPGILVATDPAVCAVLGSGACTTDVTTGTVTTGGDGSPGVGVIGSGPTTVSTGPVTTGGDDSPGVIVATDPTACLAVGSGLCPTTVTTGPVTTGGENSPGVTVVAGGPTTVTIGGVDTTGGNSDGVVVAIDPTLCLTLGGENCVTRVETGPIDTGGDGSGGVIIGDGPGTGGGGTGGGTGGTVVVVTGPINSSDDGINVDVGCIDVDITATGPIRSANGAGINATSACGVRVTTLAGAPVQGATAGIDVASGTGSTITIGDRVSAGNGLAINADGAATTLINRPTGTIVGRIDLTDASDVFANAGRFEATGNSSFGAGVDLLTNTGSILVRPGAGAPGAVTFTGLETLSNAGVIDMRNGQVGDTLTVPGTYSGTGGATLGVDVSATSADRLVVGGAATGTTVVQAAGLNGDLLNRSVVVDAGAGTSATAFGLQGGTQSVGLVDYALVYDPTTSDFALYGLPNQSAFAPTQVVDGGRQLFYRSNDAVAARLDSPGTGRAVWFQGYGLADKREGSYSTTVLGQSASYSLDTQQDFFGAQAGVDLLGTDTGSVAGVTFGYGSSRMKALGGTARTRYDSLNVGVYGKLAAGVFQLEGLAKYERVRVRYGDVGAAVSDKSHANGYGGYVKASVAFGAGKVTVLPFASLDYAKLDFDGLDLGRFTADFDEATGLRGKAGAKVEATLSEGPSRIRAYASGAYVHEFKGRDRLTLVNNGITIGYGLPSAPDYGQARIGLAIDQGETVSGFIEANGDFGKSYHGGGARAGLSVRF